MKYCYAITGVTGLLGRNLLLEIIKQNRKNLSNVSFVLFGRDSRNKQFKNRVVEILKDDLGDYIDDTSFDLDQIDEFIKERIKFINYSLKQNNLDLSCADLSYLKSQKIDFFFHSAALTNLWNDEKSKREVYKVNYQGTKNIIELAKILNIGEFNYIGTAYSCGKTYGDISPDYVNLNQEFRSEYERVKLMAEIEVRNFEKETGQKCRYFRPSVICGRMIEKEIGKTNKFDVFYGFGYAFLKIKKSKINHNDDLINTVCDLDIRYQISPNYGLNIVPVDFCVKLIYLICVNDDNDKYFHLAYHKEISHKFYFDLILRSLNLESAYPVDYYPTDKTKDEKIFYKTAGNVLLPYVTCPEIRFDVSNIKKIADKLVLPKIEEAQHFQKLLNFAKDRLYGIT